MMEPLSPIYPRTDDVWPSNQESNARALEAARSAQDAFPRRSEPSHRGASGDLSAGGTSHLINESTQLYSPTKQEIEQHPIRQRLSLSTQRDSVSTGLGTAPEDLTQAFFDSNHSSSRQAQEGSERLFGAMSDTNNIKEGDQVSYQWSGSQPGGTVTDVATHDGKGEVTMETKRGNEVKKNAEPGNPALYIERSGHDVVKQASEVEVEKEGDAHKEAPGEEKTVGDKSEEKKENGEAQTGDKRSAEETSEAKKDEEEVDAKKQKTDDDSKANGEEPKKKGRPAKKDSNGKAAPKKETKKREPKKAATESGEPRRSGRNAGK